MMFAHLIFSSILKALNLGKIGHNLSKNIRLLLKAHAPPAC
jgi:hypothetical protein